MKLSRAYAILLFFFTLTVIHLAIYTMSINTSYEIDKLRPTLSELKQQNRNLKYIVAKESSLNKIDAIARSKLGMEYPVKMNYVLVASKEAD
jgi:cell division protein FtsL